MRWTDLPRDPEPADDRERPVVQRGEWEDLKQRLERLPAGHPSSLDDEDPADEDWPEGRADEDPADEDPADEDPAAEDRADEDRADGGSDRSAERGGRTGPDRSARLPDGHEAGWAPGPGAREPYRPWFASGDSPEPWFSVDPDA
jgi:hypothetical protein